MCDTQTAMCPFRRTHVNYAGLSANVGMLWSQSRNISGTAGYTYQFIAAPLQMQCGTEVKAITYSAMQIVEEGDSAQVYVIVDI